MPTIDTLATDIAELWNREDNPLTEELCAKLGVAVAMKAHRAFDRKERERQPKVLFASEIGKPCTRQVWYGYHAKDVAEPLPASAKTKFLYGDILEDYVLTLAKAAGHDVQFEQAPVEIKLSDGWTIRGRSDAVIDSTVVDVKSCSSYAYKKFEEGLNDYNDSFGYRMQLSTYTLGLPIVLTPGEDMQGFVAIDKQNGHIGYFPSTFIDPTDRGEELVEALSKVTLPKKAFEAVPDGKSGNMKLPVNCSYCAFKQACWADANNGAGLRAFSYATGPVFLTEVKRTPNVPEIPFNTP